MSTWTGKFKAVPGLGQTQGPGGSVINPQSMSVDQALNLAPGRGGTERFLWDYRNQGTDNFLRTLAGQGQDLQGSLTVGAVSALTGGLNRRNAQTMLEQRDRLRKGTARAFMGPDGSFIFRDVNAAGDMESGLPQGVARMDGTGSFNPVAQALSSTPDAYREFKDTVKRAGVNWQAPLWLHLSRSMGGGTLPPGAWR